MAIDESVAITPKREVLKRKLDGSKEGKGFEKICMMDDADQETQNLMKQAETAKQSRLGQ